MVSISPLLPHQASKETKTGTESYLYIGFEVGFPVQLRLTSSLPSSCLSLLRSEFASAHHHAGLGVHDTEGFRRVAPLVEAGI